MQLPQTTTDAEIPRLAIQAHAQLTGTTLQASHRGLDAAPMSSADHLRSLFAATCRRYPQWHTLSLLSRVPQAARPRRRVSTVSVDSSSSFTGPSEAVQHKKFDLGSKCCLDVAGCWGEDHETMSVRGSDWR